MDSADYGKGSEWRIEIVTESSIPCPITHLISSFLFEVGGKFNENFRKIFRKFIGIFPYIYMVVFVCV